MLIKEASNAPNEKKFPSPRSLRMLHVFRVQVFPLFRQLFVHGVVFEALCLIFQLKRFVRFRKRFVRFRHRLDGLLQLLDLLAKLQDHEQLLLLPLRRRAVRRSLVGGLQRRGLVPSG